MTQRAECHISVNVRVSCHCLLRCDNRFNAIPYLALGNLGRQVAVVAVVDSEEARGASIELGVGVIRGV